MKPVAPARKESIQILRPCRVWFAFSISAITFICSLFCKREANFDVSLAGLGLFHITDDEHAGGRTEDHDRDGGGLGNLIVEVLVLLAGNVHVELTLDQVG